MANLTPSKSGARLLVVEDEKNVGSTLVERLEKEGYQVAWVKTFEEAKLYAESREFELALLDVGLPDGSGFDVAKILKQRSSQTAIIFLTAWGTPEDRIKGLELGAEDYVVKPFHFKELLLRIQNVLKRTSFLIESALTLSEPVLMGKANVWFSRFEIETNGLKSQLTHKECALLRYLFDHKGKVLSRDEILNHVWGEEEYPTARTVDNFIVKLRRFIELDPNEPVIIKSVRGVGYQLDLEAKI